MCVKMRIPPHQPRLVMWECRRKGQKERARGVRVCGLGGGSPLSPIGAHSPRVVAPSPKLHIYTQKAATNTNEQTEGMITAIRTGACRHWDHQWVLKPGGMYRRQVRVCVCAQNGRGECTLGGRGGKQQNTEIHSLEPWSDRPTWGLH